MRTGASSAALPAEDYATDLAERSISLTPAGGQAQRPTTISKACGSVRAREELVTQALSALVLFRRTTTWSAKAK